MRLRTTRALGILLLLLLVAGVIAALTYIAPERGVRPTTLGGWIGAAVPYIVVALLGLSVGLAELSSTFPNYPLEAITSNWGLLLLGVNGIVAAVVFAIARYYSPETNTFLLVLAVGIGFQSIIRTRFVLAKQFGGDGEGRDLSLNLGWLYEQFQNLCKTQIDLVLMRNRQSTVEHLITRYPSEKELYNLAYFTIVARTLSREEEQARIDELNNLMKNISLPPEVIRRGLALMILEVGGQAFAELLCRPAPGEMVAMPAAASPAAANRDQLVGKLVDSFGLDELANLARQAVDRAPAGEDREALMRFVEGTVGDTRASEQSRKVILARFIVDKGGIPFATEVLSTRQEGPTPAAG
jgi:hypothetical protein